MSSGSQTLYTGIISCSDDFDDAYCIRKITQLLLSSMILTSAVIALVNIIRKQRARFYAWLVLLLAAICFCLIINILFCFFNNKYWLYAIETYFYNLYYLFLVGYVAKSYLLKYRQIINIKRFFLDPENLKIRDKERRIFYVILISIGLIYTFILIASLILEILQEKNDDADTHCSQIWYLSFQGGCLVLSIIVMLMLYKNQVEESCKIEEYQKQFQKRGRGSLMTESKKNTKQIRGPQSKINNPLKLLWVWIILNVAGQIFNLLQSIFFLKATPPGCLIIENSFEGSNILELIFVIFTTYLCFVSTLLYISKTIMVSEEKVGDIVMLMNNQTEGTPNIELNPPEMTKKPSNSID